MDATVASDFVEMRVADVRRLPAEGELPRRHFVVLTEVDGARRLPFLIGEPEAQALAVHLEQVELPRPMPHTLMARLIQAASGHLREVRITRLADMTFYAEIVVEGTQGVQSVDARPSDALNLALRANVPIRVATAVLEVASVETSTAAAQPDSQGGRRR